MQDGNDQEITSLNDIGNLNPFRYRGYYFDSDTGLYYISSRYYDPEACRFLNADRLIDEAAGLQGANLFQYCGNNPVNHFDSIGQFVLTISACIAIGSVVIGALAFGHTAATSYKYTGSVDWFGAAVNGVSWGLTVYTMGMSVYGVYCNYSYSTGKTPVTSVNVGKRFVAPVNTPVEKLSLPPDKINAPNQIFKKTVILKFFRNEVTKCYLKNPGNIKQQALMETANFLVLIFLIMNGEIRGKQ